MTKDLKFLIKIVKQSARIITKDFIVNSKDNNNDLITNFDLEIEEYIIKKLNNSYPDFKIISEEFNTNEQETKNYFTIDPIDGTINFAHQIPIWGIQIAMIREGKTCASVLYFPKIKEIYYADETGAYFNGSLLDLSEQIPMSNLLIDQIYLEKEDKFYEKFTIDNPASLKARIIRKFYCASISYSWIANGRLSAFVFAKHLPWDTTPGMFLVEQAKGAITTFEHNNKPYYVAAINKEILDVVVKVIKNTQWKMYHIKYLSNHLYE